MELSVELSCIVLISALEDQGLQRPALPDHPDDTVLVDLVRVTDEHVVDAVGVEVVELVLAQFHRGRGGGRAGGGAGALVVVAAGLRVGVGPGVGAVGVVTGESQHVVRDDLLVTRTALVQHWLLVHRLGGLRVGLEALVFLDEGDEEVLVAELHVAPDLVLSGPGLLRLRLEGGDDGGETEVIERPLHHLPANKPRVVDKLAVRHLSLFRVISVTALKPSGRLHSVLPQFFLPFISPRSDAPNLAGQVKSNAMSGGESGSGR